MPAPDTMHGQALALGEQLRSRRAAGARCARRRRAVPERLPLRPRRLGRGRAPRDGAARRATSRSRSTSPVGVHLPGWVGPGTLVVVTSYSGETLEAIDWFAEAGARGATRVVVGSGGTLARAGGRGGRAGDRGRGRLAAARRARAAAGATARAAARGRRRARSGGADRVRRRRRRHGRAARRRGEGGGGPAGRRRHGPVRLRHARRRRGAPEEPAERERQGGRLRRRRARDRAQRDPGWLQTPRGDAAAHRGVPARPGGAARRDGAVERADRSGRQRRGRRRDLARGRTGRAFAGVRAAASSAIWCRAIWRTWRASTRWTSRGSPA